MRNTLCTFSVSPTLRLVQSDTHSYLNEGDMLLLGKPA